MTQPRMRRARQQARHPGRLTDFGGVWNSIPLRRVDPRTSVICRAETLNTNLQGQHRKEIHP